MGYDGKGDLVYGAFWEGALIYNVWLFTWLYCANVVSFFVFNTFTLLFNLFSSVFTHLLLSL